MHTKKFYWIKLKTDFFSRAEIDFILSQEDGFKYIVLYLILCLNTANTNGELKTQINDLIVPYDIDKIVTYTTRKPRVGEVNKVDYNFVSEKKFLKLMKEGFFAETTYFNGFYLISSSAFLFAFRRG